jgi:glycosyltransferase involved in cell wall biosynthesis
MHVVINAVSGARHPSGICRHAANLARCLFNPNEVSKISLAVGAWQEGYFRAAFELQDRKLQIVLVPISDRALARNFWYLFGLPKTIQELGADVLHLSFPVPILRNKITVPVVTTVHDLYPFDAPENFGFPNVLANRLFLRQCLRASDRLACVSDFTLDRLLTIFGPRLAGKATRIYNSVELSQAYGQSRELVGLSGRPFLLCVAQHRRNKNLKLLLQAFAEMRAQAMVSPETMLLVVGRPGPETTTVVGRITQLGLKHSVLLVKGLINAELAWLYRNCELLLAPSEVEGFGLPVVEAKQCGARVVCSDIPAFREVGGSTCCYFDLKAADPVGALLQACRVALQEPGGMEISFPQFSFQASARAYISLYSELLQKAHSPVNAGANMHLTRQHT